MKDIYDYIEIIYRFFLLCVAALASGFITYASIFPVRDNLIVSTISWFFWLIFVIGVAAYLIFVAKGSFRPKKKQQFMDTYHCFEYLQKLEKNE